jgi:hypothetical protein
MNLVGVPVMETGGGWGNLWAACWLEIIYQQARMVMVKGGKILTREEFIASPSLAIMVTPPTLLHIVMRQLPHMPLKVQGMPQTQPQPHPAPRRPLEMVKH